MTAAPSTTLVTIRDTQVIELIEFGDPAGEPYIFFPSFLGSCYQASLLDEHARELGIRIISVNKPGTGKTTYKEYPTMKDYAKDIELLADQLNIHTFGTIGLSLGSTMALACGAASPDRISKMCVAGALPPMNDPHFSHDMDSWRHETLRKCSRKRTVMNTYFRSVSLMTRLCPRLVIPLLLIYYSRMNPAELNAPRIQDMLRRDIADVFLSRDCVRGLAQEMYLASHWGFSLEELTTPVLMMHGLDDEIAPITGAKRMAAAMPACRCFFFEGNHYSIIRRAQTALDTLQNLHGFDGMQGIDRPEEPVEDRLLPLLGGLRTI